MTQTNTTNQLFIYFHGILNELYLGFLNEDLKVQCRWQGGISAPPHVSMACECSCVQMGESKVNFLMENTKLRLELCAKYLLFVWKNFVVMKIKTNVHVTSSVVDPHLGYADLDPTH